MEPAILVGALTTSSTSRSASSASASASANADVPSVLDALAPSPWARVRRVQLIRREVREFLSVHALQLLFERADRVVEGGRDDEQRAYATVMLSVDLRDCAEIFREIADAATAARVAELLEGDAWLRRHLRGLAREALRAQVGAGARRGRLSVDFQVRSNATHLLVDCDAMLSKQTRTAEGSR